MHQRPLYAFHALRALTCALFVGGLLAAGAAFANTFPHKPVRIVVPFSPGGGTDLIARTLGQEMSKDLGQPVIIDNKPGAGTIIGTDAIAKAQPDGYSLVMASFAHAVNPSLQPKLPFDNAKAFAPVILVGRGPNVLVVRPASPFKTVADVLAAAKANPGKLTYASQGAGTSAHLAGEMFDNLAKVKTLHIPYRGAGPAMTDLMGGQVELFFGTAAAVAPFVERGQLRAIAVTSAVPSAAFKGVPTISATIPGYAVESWYGLYAPAGTPKDVIDRLNAAGRKAARSPDFTRKVEQEGLNIAAGDPTELDTYVRGEEARWARIVKENGIKAD